MKRWKAKGYEVARTAGSHGLWDVIAVRGNRSVELIQCKLTADRATANRMLKRHTSDPPMAPSDCYHQVLEVKVKGSTDIMSITV